MRLAWIGLLILVLSEGKIPVADASSCYANAEHSGAMAPDYSSWDAASVCVKALGEDRAISLNKTMREVQHAATSGSAVCSSCGAITSAEESPIDGGIEGDSVTQHTRVRMKSFGFDSDGMEIFKQDTAAAGSGSGAHTGKGSLAFLPLDGEYEILGIDLMIGARYSGDRTDIQVLIYNGKAFSHLTYLQNGEFKSIPPEWDEMVAVYCERTEIPATKQNIQCRGDGGSTVYSDNTAAGVFTLHAGTRSSKIYLKGSAFSYGSSTLTSKHWKDHVGKVGGDAWALASAIIIVAKEKHAQLRSVRVTYRKGEP